MECSKVKAVNACGTGTSGLEVEVSQTYRPGARGYGKWGCNCKCYCNACDVEQTYQPGARRLLMKNGTADRVKTELLTGSVGMGELQAYNTSGSTARGKLQAPESASSAVGQ